MSDEFVTIDADRAWPEIPETAEELDTGDVVIYNPDCTDVDDPQEWIRSDYYFTLMPEQ